MPSEHGNDTVRPGRDRTEFDQSQGVWIHFGVDFAKRVILIQAKTKGSNAQGRTQVTKQHIPNPLAYYGMLGQ